MSTTIDSKVVEMKFDTKSFSRGVKDVNQGISDLKKNMNFDSVTQSFADISKSADSVNLDNLTNGVEEATNQFSILKTVGVGALLTIGNKVAEVGMNMAKSLTVAPIMEGFGEYELKMGSIQTIMAGTGASLQEVNGYLEELNTYSDQTIYSFADMTQNIGKFTNAGVSLKDAVASIKGISNVAAISGANTQEASRAMYNFSQALSAGHVKLIDWKSIENANMATVGFKTELLEAAVAAGTLTKGVDGMYETLEGNALNATQNFNDTLQDQWMTTEVLTKTLNKYADSSTEIGKKATAAATEIKTFTMLMDTLKEAVGSGWAQSFELLIGDFEEAKKLWTGIGEAVGGFIDQMSDARNNAIKAFVDLGGRKNVLEGLGNIFKAIGKVLSPIGDAFREVFGAFDAKPIAEAAEAFKKFTAKLIISDVAAQRIKKAFVALFSVLKTLAKIVGVVLKALGALISVLVKIATVGWAVLSPFVNFIVNIFGTAMQRAADAMSRAADFINGIFDSIRDNSLSAIGDTFGSILPNAFGIFAKSADGSTKSVKDSVSGMAKGISSTVKSTFPGLHKAIENIGKAFEWIGQKIATAWDFIVEKIRALGALIGKGINQVKEAFADMSPGEVFDKVIKAVTALSSILASAGIAKMFIDMGSGAKTMSGAVSGSFGGLTSIFTNLAGGIKSAMGAVNAFGEIMEGLSGVISAHEKNVKADTLMKIALGIGALALSMLLLSTISGDRVITAIAALTAVSAVMVGLAVALEKFVTTKGTAKLPFIAAALIMLSVSLLILAVAVKILSTMSWDEVGRGLAALAGSIMILVAATYALEKAKGIMKAATMLAVLGLAVIFLAAGLKILSKLSWDEIARSLTTLAGAMAILVTAVNLVGAKVRTMLAFGAAMFMMATAIFILAKAIARLGALDIPSLVKGLGAIAVALGLMIGVVWALHKASSASTKTAIFMLAIAHALLMMSKAVSSLASLSIKELAKGLGAVAVMLAVMVGAALALGAAGGKLIFASIALLAIAASLSVLVGIVERLAGMSLEAVIGGLVKLTIVIVALVAIGVIIGALAKFLLLGAVALAAFALALYLVVGVFAAFGLALMVLAAGITALSLVAPVMISTFLNLGIAFLTLVPFIPVILLLTVLIGAFALVALVSSIGIVVLSLGLGLLALALGAIAMILPMVTMALMGFVMGLAGMLLYAPAAAIMLVILLAMAAVLLVMAVVLAAAAIGFIIIGLAILIAAVGFAIMAAVLPMVAVGLQMFAGAAMMASGAILALVAASVGLLPLVAVFAAFAVAGAAAGAGLMLLSLAMLLLGLGMTMLAAAGPSGADNIRYLLDTIIPFVWHAASIATMAGALALLGAALLVFGAGALIAGAGAMILGAGFALMMAASQGLVERLQPLAPALVAFAGATVALMPAALIFAALAAGLMAFSLVVMLAVLGLKLIIGGLKSFGEGMAQVGDMAMEGVAKLQQIITQMASMVTQAGAMVILGAAFLALGTGMSVLGLGMTILNGAALAFTATLVGMMFPLMLIGPGLTIFTTQLRALIGVAGPLAAIVPILAIFGGSLGLLAPVSAMAGAAFMILGMAMTVLNGALTSFMMVGPIGSMALLLMGTALAKLAPTVPTIFALSGAFGVLAGASLLIVPAVGTLMGLAVSLAFLSNSMSMLVAVAAAGILAIQSITSSAAAAGALAGEIGIFAAALGGLGLAGMALAPAVPVFGAFGAAMTVVTNAVLMLALMGRTGINVLTELVAAFESSKKVVGHISILSATIMALSVGMGVLGTTASAAIFSVTVLAALFKRMKSDASALARVLIFSFPAAISHLERFGVTAKATAAVVEAGMRAMSNSVVNQIPVVNRAINNLISSMVLTLVFARHRIRDVSYDLGRTVPEGIVDGIRRSGASEVYHASKDLGRYITDGIRDGISINSSAVRRSAVDVARVAVRAASAELQIKSPSRVFMKIGKHIDDGLALGIRDNSAVVDDESRKVGLSAMDAMRKSLNDVESTVDANMDVNPTIRPVLDLSDVKKQSKDLRSIFGHQSLTVGAIHSNARSVESDFNERVYGDEVAAQTINNETNNVTFTQNNYSPEALSTKEIQRNTETIIAKANKL